MSFKWEFDLNLPPPSPESPSSNQQDGGRLGISEQIPSQLSSDLHNFAADKSCHADHDVSSGDCLKTSIIRSHFAGLREPHAVTRTAFRKYISSEKSFQDKMVDGHLFHSSSEAVTRVQEPADLEATLCSKSDMNKVSSSNAHQLQIESRFLDLPQSVHGSETDSTLQGFENSAEVKEGTSEASLASISVYTRTLDRQPISASENGPETNSEVGKPKRDKGTSEESGLDSSSVIQEQQMITNTSVSDFLGQQKKSEKDVMLGRKRGRQTVLLETNESLQRAKPTKVLATQKTLAAPNLSLNPSRQTKDSPRHPINLPEKPGDIISKKTFPVARQDINLGSDSRRVSEYPEKLSGVDEEKSVPSASSDNKQGGEEMKVEKPQFQRPSVRRQGESGQTRTEDVTQKHMPYQMHRLTSKKQSFSRKPQDSSIERLHREITSSKLWQNPGEMELQRVPGCFSSIDEYVEVFEPLLFEESRAQLHSVWEEYCDLNLKDVHIPVSIKTIEKRERGWYDVIVLPLDPRKKFSFKEGDIAVISTPRPGSDGRGKGRGKDTQGEEARSADGRKRVAGTVRRYVPVDVRGTPGAILHFHVLENDLENKEKDMTISSNASSILGHFQDSSLTWFLTVLGSLATTQREYVALNALQRLHPQMVKAILHPQEDNFPQYDKEPPAMPSCFTPSFVQHLRGNFNAPQLSAIQWAAMHTAAGSSITPTGSGRKQEPWPFTLVQGPPGTGKTHTVWGMLNVIHLVQYQHYYAALLKKLAPGSVSQSTENSSNLCNDERSSWMDEVLEKMDRSLARTLPRLCPKPRMLVCAPSNAATDELLSRVLDRGFIDGEMKIYRPDVARVGTDAQSRAAQAVSVERRSDQLLAKSREEVAGWLQQLRVRERNLAQNVASIQRDLQATASARSQCTVGVDPEALTARDQARDSKLQQLAALVEERDKLLVEMSRLYIIESVYRPGGISQDEARGKLEASFVSEAEVVFTTVSSSGRRLFTNLARGFDIVVIDEAAQASEVAVLPPLNLGAGRCVLVGDPQQLPATVISRVADTMQYSRSLFERFQQAGCPTIMLTVQYRMHPQIRDFPSRYFYQGRLLDSDGVKNSPDEIYHKDPTLQPYLFFDVSHGRESHGGSVSYQNVVEAQFAVCLYQHLKSVLQSAGTFKISVGIISPYKLQLKCLQKEFDSVLGSDPNIKELYINTVDAFQGQERDVIIMSCVRASSHGVGFVADIRRMNVALTRARRSLWVIGNATTLQQSEDWASLISDARTRGCFVPFETSIVRGLIPDPHLGGNQAKDSGVLQSPKDGSGLKRNMNTGAQFSQAGKDGRQGPANKNVSYGRHRQNVQGSFGLGNVTNRLPDQQRDKLDREKVADHGKGSK